MTTTPPYLKHEQIIESLFDAYPAWPKTQARVIAKFLCDMDGIVQTQILRYEDALPLIASQKLSEFIVDRRTNLVLTNLANAHEISRSALYVVHTTDLAKMESLTKHELADYLLGEIDDYATQYLTDGYGYFRSSRGPLFIGADYPLNFQEKKIYNRYSIQTI